MANSLAKTDQEFAKTDQAESSKVVHLQRLRKREGEKREKERVFSLKSTP